jgi:hypothetical protein
MRWTIILGLSVLTLSLQAQGFNYSVDAQTEYNKVESFFRQEKQFGFSMAKQGHRIRVAPIFQIYTTEARDNIRGFEFTGISTSYIYECGSHVSFLNFFFKYEGTYQSFENSWSATQFNLKSQQYQNYSFESVEFFSAQTLGYGFSVNLYKGLYIQNSIAAGIRLSKLKGENESASDPSSVVYDFRGYDDFGFHWKAAFAIGYRF